MILDIRTVGSPIGPLSLWALGGELVGLEFTDRASRVSGLARALERDFGAFDTRETPDPAGAATRLAAYFAGDLAALDAQPVKFAGTPFQHGVWRALRTIPAGKTWSYARLAKHVGRQAAVRAAGAANGANRIALFVPCHRVIASDSTLGGYGGGLDRKRWLLAHEHARFADQGAQAELAWTAAR